MNAPTVRRVVVLGTGTGVGKTHVTRALLLAARALGFDAVGLKPVESGVTPDAADSTDAALLADAAGVFHVKHSRHAFPDPVSPHLAARRAGVRIDLGDLRRWVDAHEAPLTLIETAGGALSPLDRGATNLDLALALAPARLLLVAPDRLGVLHDLAATLLALKALRAPAPVVVLSSPDHPDASTGTNAAELATLGTARVAATFPRATPGDATTRRTAETTLAALGVTQRTS